MIIVSVKLVKRREEQRGKSNLLQCIKKYLEVLTQRRFPLTSIRAAMLYGYTGKGENLRLCCAQMELEKEICNLRFT